MLVSEVLSAINLALNDAANTVHTEATKITSINEAIELCVKLDPKSCVTTGNIDLVAGLKQTLATGSERLLSISYNTGAAGNTPGRSIKYTTTEKLASINKDWPSEAVGTAVREYCYDPDADPMTFFVVPPLSGATKVMASVSQIPADVSANDDTFPLRDSYRNPVVEFALYRLFTRDDVGTDNYTRGQGHFQKGAQMLGVWTAIEDKGDQELRQ